MASNRADAERQQHHYRFIGALDPTDHRTHSVLMPIVETLERIDTTRLVAPSHEIWLEASIISGSLRARSPLQKKDRRKFLNDSLLFLLAGDHGCVMISRNSRHRDLLLQMKPQIAVLLYEKN